MRSLFSNFGDSSESFLEIAVSAAIFSGMQPLEIQKPENPKIRIISYLKTIIYPFLVQ
jgi:hypothetical protein